MNKIEKEKLLSSPLRYFLTESNLYNFLRKNKELTIFANTNRIEPKKWTILKLKHNTYEIEFNQGIQSNTLEMVTSQIKELIKNKKI